MKRGWLPSPLRLYERLPELELCDCGARLETVGDVLAHIEHSSSGSSSSSRWCPACNARVSLDAYVLEHFDHARRCVSVRATMRVRRSVREQRVWLRKTRLPERPRQVDVYELASRLDPTAAALERMIRRARGRGDTASAVRLESMLARHVRRAHPVPPDPKLCELCDRRFVRKVDGRPRCHRHAHLGAEASLPDDGAELPSSGATLQLCDEKT